MPKFMLKRVIKAIQDALTIDEVYDKAEAACHECGYMNARCPGYGKCEMMALLDLKVDAIEALS